MDLQAHEGLEALHEALHGFDARRRAGSECGGRKTFSFEAHIQISKRGRRKTKNPVARGLPGLVEHGGRASRC